MSVYPAALVTVAAGQAWVIIVCPGLALMLPLKRPAGAGRVRVYFLWPWTGSAWKMLLKSRGGLAGSLESTDQVGRSKSGTCEVNFEGMKIN